MALAEAKALAADLLALPWDEERIARAALEVITALLAASPRVSWNGTHGRADARTRGEGLWWVDAAGLGSEAKLADRLLAIASGLGFGPARAGIASSAIAAYAATYGGTRARTRRRTAVRPRIVPPGGDAAYLAPFPVTLLDLDDDLAEILRGLGLTTLGQLAALEADEVDARFGPEGLAAHRRARGLDTRGPSTPRDDALPVIEVDLGGGVATSEPLLFVLRGALATLGEALRAKGLAARELTIALRLDDGSTAERAVRPARATSHADALFDHCRVALETWQLPEPATGLVLRAAITVPAAGEQGDLLAPRWADPAALAAAFDRIRGSEGPDAVAVPETRDAHLPADQGSWTHGGTDARTHGQAGTRIRGGTDTLTASLRLLGAPVPVHVRLGREGLAAFRHDDGWHDVTGWSGPERLAPRWWLGPDAVRDYYATRTAEGALWLLYRAVGGQWFLEGWWD
jgi:protein ImuB